jgi:hypothetical protein
MRLDVTTPDVEPVLQLSPRGIEGIVDGYVDILVGLLVVGHATDRNFTAFGPDVDDDVKKPPFALMLVRRFDRHPAADDIVPKQFEFICVLANGCLDKFGTLEVLESDL